MFRGAARLQGKLCSKENCATTSCSSSFRKIMLRSPNSAARGALLFRSRLLNKAHIPALAALSTKSRPNESLPDEMKRLAGYAQTSVSLKATLDTGLGLLLPSDDGTLSLSRRQRTLIQIASFLRRELPVRLARRVIELEQLPEGLHSMKSVQRVRDWYEQSFVDIRRSRQPVDVETEVEFFEVLSKVYDRHAATLITMARGVHELKHHLHDRDEEQGAASPEAEQDDDEWSRRVGSRTETPSVPQHGIHCQHIYV